ncbi:hypothetical protein HNY73_011613 [Argiope bruennichi]|uniref:Uncharacterized protein n=1 Tax=Argiope bruennichi TaxID=94029 RepID=A0A8T0EZD0_ARGBR|nr:hypothetical protein HNY73_011613 [Argiope bruennichi]
MSSRLSSLSLDSNHKTDRTVRNFVRCFNELNRTKVQFMVRLYCDSKPNRTRQTKYLVLVTIDSNRTEPSTRIRCRPSFVHDDSKPNRTSTRMSLASFVHDDSKRTEPVQNVVLASFVHDQNRTNQYKNVVLASFVHDDQKPNRTKVLLLSCFPCTR